jgi:uncharacterized cupin superfamily protein
VTLVHWDDVEGFDIPARFRPVAGRWQRLADAAGSVRVGAQRVVLAPGQLTTPPHTHSAEEEIVHVLRGSGTLWQGGSTCTVVAGDTIVHPARSEPHTLIGGDDGFEVLIFGTRVLAEHAVLPRTGVAWIGDRGVTLNGAHPWEAEAALGIPEGAPADRPANVVALDDVEGDYGGISKRLGAAGGAKRSGLNRLALPSNEEGAPPHCHSSEEEVFVVLEGEGTLELWGAPKAGAMPRAEPDETHSLRRGHVVSRPAGTRISHCFRAGADGLAYLAYGTRDPNDVAYYPRSNKIFFRGLGLVARLEPLDYFDGEPG